MSLSLEFGTVTAVGLRSWVNELSIKDAEGTLAECTPWLKKMFDIHSDQHVQVILLKQVDQRPDDVANC